jgi:hypothetical protein
MNSLSCKLFPETEFPTNNIGLLFLIKVWASFKFEVKSFEGITNLLF